MPGKGKTMSFRNMNPKTTGYINMEGKPLPFVNQFEHYSMPSTWQEAYQKLIEYAKNDAITEVVFDSFSSYLDSLVKYARETKKGFDTWNLYNEEVGKLLFVINKYPKDIFVTAHYEWVESEEGAVEKRVAVKGKEWKGMIEKTFTIVHFADVKFDDKNKRHYYLQLNTDGKSSAKTPPMFLMNEDENEVENDYSLFLKRVRDKLNNKK